MYIEKKGIVPDSVISLDSDRIKYVDVNGRRHIEKATTYEEYMNYRIATTKLEQNKVADLLGIKFSLQIPSRVEWCSKDSLLITNKENGYNLEQLLRDPNSYCNGKHILCGLLAHFLRNDFLWLDFAPRNVLVSFESCTITLVDFEKGFYSGAPDEYIALIVEEYSLFLEIKDNLFFDSLGLILRSNKDVLFKYIIYKSKRIDVLSQLLEAKYDLLDIYWALIMAECPGGHTSTLFPVIRYEEILKTEGYDAWGKAIIRSVEFHLKKIGNKVNEYRPFPCVEGFFMTEEKDHLLYNRNNVQYSLCVRNSPFIPKSGMLLCQYIEEIVSAGSISSFLDLGTGPVAFLARHACALGVKKVDAVDIDSTIIEHARKSKKSYEQTLNIYSSNLYGKVHNKFDLIVSNPPQMPIAKELHPLHDSSGHDGREVIERIIRESSAYLNVNGYLLLLAFDFLGIEKPNNDSTESLCDIAKKSNLLIERIDRINVPIRPNGAISKNTSLIQRLYPGSHFTGESNEICILVFRKASLDIGIEKPNYPAEQHRGYIKFVGADKTSFVFREELGCGESNRVEIREGVLTKHPQTEKNIVGELISQNRTDTYYICNNPPRLIISNSVSSEIISLDEYPGKPIFICEDASTLFITFMNGGLLSILKTNLQDRRFWDLRRIGFVEPIYMQPTSKGFLITDSSAHVVRLIDEDMSILWEYGQVGVPGSEDNMLCVPVNAFFFGGNVIISEQRSHRILEISFTDRKVLRQFGITNQIGQENELLWAPQAVPLQEKLFIVMCKGSGICIYEVCEEGELHLYYGKPLLCSSIFNFPRACDYSKNQRKLAVCDTYHNRVCIFDEFGAEVHSIYEVASQELKWPRCVKWHEDCLYIANSLCNHVYCLQSGTCLKWMIDLRCFTNTDEWVQSVDINHKNMLIAYETFVLVINYEEKEVIYSSLGIVQLKDVHQAQLLEDGTILIADTGHNRVVLLRNGVERTIDSLIYNSKTVSLSKPRMVNNYDGKVFIVNSGTSQVYICDQDMKTILGIYGGERGMNEHRLSIPRWVSPGPNNLFFISDTDNHRVVLRDIIHKQ